MANSATSSLSLVAPLLIVLVLVEAATAQEEYCYALDPDPYSLHASYTSYFEVQNPDAEPITFEGCTAKSYWAITRHGSQYPEEDDFEDLDGLMDLQERIVQNHVDGTGLLCDEDLELIQNWTFDVTLDQADMLTASGAVEQAELGRRLAQRFPELIGQAYNEDLFRVRTTDTERTMKSAEVHLTVGVFPGEDVLIPPPLEEDPLLRPYDFCTKWEEDVNDNPETEVEQELFEEEQPVLDTVANINRRLGFLDDPLTFGDVDMMYDMCRYDRIARPGRPSAWCLPFEQDDLVVMEYHADLKFWYTGSYGSDINREVNCPQVKDIADTFNMSDDEMPVGTFYFTHGTNQLLFTTTLGLYEDDIPLLHDNFEENADRLFRSSFLKPFSVNFEFVLYDCDEEGGEEPVRRLLTLHNEAGVTLPGCDEPLCRWDQFQENYQELIECPFDEICENE